MAKRFTDNDKYKKPFFRGLQGAYKLLWDYLYHDCNHAGIWIVDFEVAQIYIGNDMLVYKDHALEYFNEDEERIIVFDNGKKWFIPSFIEFQYGELKENNRVHLSVINILKKYNLFKGLTSPLQGVKDKDKDMDKDIDIEKDIEKEEEEHSREKKIILAKIQSKEKFIKYCKGKYPDKPTNDKIQIFKLAIKNLKQELKGLK